MDIKDCKVGMKIVFTDCEGGNYNNADGESSLHWARHNLNKNTVYIINKVDISIKINKDVIWYNAHQFEPLESCLVEKEEYEIGDIVVVTNNMSGGCYPNDTVCTVTTINNSPDSYRLTKIGENNVVANNYGVKEFKLLKTNKTMENFIIEGSDALKCAFVKECIALGFEVTPGIQSAVDTGKFKDSNVRIRYKYVDYIPEKPYQVYNLPEQYNEALEVVKNMKPATPQPVEKKFIMDGYDLELTSKGATFGCKENISATMIAKVASVVKFLDDVLDDRNEVFIDSDGLHINGDLLSYNDLKEIESKVRNY